ncbi:MAG: alpha/beta hydrolase [Bacteroidota bacterium]
MKYISKLFLVVLSISLFIACEKADNLIDNNEVQKKAKDFKNQPPGLDQERFVTMKAKDFAYLNVDLKIHYRIIGKGPIDMVWIPGWTNPITVFTKQFDYFKDKARSIYIDLPGHGLSDTFIPSTYPVPAAYEPDGEDCKFVPVDYPEPDSEGMHYTMEMMADAMYTVLKKEGVHKFTAVGFSWGPKVLGKFEKTYPGMIQKLVAIDGGFKPGVSELENFCEYMGQYQWTEGFKAFLANYLGGVYSGLEPDPELLELLQYFVEFPSIILADMNYQATKNENNVPVGWMYPKLCFYANPTPNMDKVNLFYPNNTVYTFPGGGHVIHWLFADEINPLIADFVKDRPGNKY